MHLIKRAVIMAAGKGSRLDPLTRTTPKPLIRVNGTRLIDTAIRALRGNGIDEIYVVTGHLKECYAALPEEYPGLTLIENPYYDTCNNISSVFVAREHLSDTIIMDADFLIKNPAILRPEFDRSCYCAKLVEKPNPAEWMLTLDEAGTVISCVTDGSCGTHQLYGISMWTAEDGARLGAQVEEQFLDIKRRDVYWDTLPIFTYAGEYSLGVRVMGHDDITEIDTLEDLAKADGAYEKYLTR